MSDFSKLHIYGQDLWHDSATIVGDEEALENLGDAIDKALEDGQSKSESFVKDGEGYEILISKHDDMDELPTPYESDIATNRAKENLNLTEVKTEILNKTKGVNNEA